MKKEFFEKGILTVCLAAGMILGSGFCSLAAVLPDGLQVGGQELGGLSREEADRKIEEYVDGLPDQTISIQVGDQTLETTTKAMGLSWSNRDAVDEVVSALTEGNLLKRYMAETDLEQEGREIPVETAVDEAAVTAFVTEQCSGMEGGAKNASITRENGEFVITPSEKGVTVDTAATVQAINEAVAGGVDEPVEVEAVITEAEPEITTEMLSTIKDVLAPTPPISAAAALQERRTWRWVRLN